MVSTKLKVMLGVIVGAVLVPLSVVAAPNGWDNVENNWANQTNDNTSQTTTNNSPSTNTVTRWESRAQNMYDTRTNNNSNADVPTNNRVRRNPTISRGSQQGSNDTNDDNNRRQPGGEALTNDQRSQTIADNNSQPSQSSQGSDNKQTKKVKTYSKDELVGYAKQAGQKLVNQVKTDNQARLDTNNAKGANELYDAYKLQVRAIKKAKISDAERMNMIASQKTALQKALNTRLANLQKLHDDQINDLSNQINKLKDTHKQDKTAISLQSDMATADYQLGVASNKAYKRYNHAVNQLEQSQTVKKTRNQKLRDAKTEYQGNLDALGATDPNKLKKHNKAQLKRAKQLAKDVVSQAEAGSFKNPNEIDDYLTM